MQSFFDYRIPCAARLQLGLLQPSRASYPCPWLIEPAINYNQTDSTMQHANLDNMHDPTARRPSPQYRQFLSMSGRWIQPGTIHASSKQAPVAWTRIHRTSRPVQYTRKLALGSGQQHGKPGPRLRHALLLPHMTIAKAASTSSELKVGMTSAVMPGSPVSAGAKHGGALSSKKYRLGFIPNLANGLYKERD